MKSRLKGQIKKARKAILFFMIVSIPRKPPPCGGDLPLEPSRIIEIDRAQCDKKCQSATEILSAFAENHGFSRACTPECVSVAYAPELQRRGARRRG
jgi:hypothetical protein